MCRAVYLDSGSLHTTVRTAYLVLLLDELEKAIDADTHRAVAESCIAGVRAHLTRTYMADEPISRRVVDGLLAAHGYPEEN